MSVAFIGGSPPSPPLKSLETWQPHIDNMATQEQAFEYMTFVDNYYLEKSTRKRLRLVNEAKSKGITFFDTPEAMTKQARDAEICVLSLIASMYKAFVQSNEGPRPSAEAKQDLEFIFEMRHHCRARLVRLAKVSGYMPQE